MPYPEAKNQLFPFSLFGVLVMIFCISCGSDTAPVDSHYIQSKEFQKFNTELQNENTFRLDIDDLNSFLQQLSTCPKVRELELPIQFNNINFASNNYFKSHKCNGLSELSKAYRNIQFAGYTQYNDLLIRWILISSSSFYKNQRLVAAVYKDDELFSAQGIGIFRDNLARNETTDISIQHVDGQLLITSILNRDIKYPMKLNDVLVSRYVISKDGNIAKQ